MSRFGEFSEDAIDVNIEKTIPPNTKKSRSFVWKQFIEFCVVRNNKLERETSVHEIAKVLKDWGYNMRKNNGDEYKESTIKVMWNLTAKMVMEEYFEKYGIKIDPFEDQEFKAARYAKNAKRKELQKHEDKRKVSSIALKYNEMKMLIDNCNECTPEGLQKKLFFIFSYELAWRGGEGSKTLLEF